MADADSIGRACAVAGCACLAKTKGLCVKHYAQHRKYGTTGPRQQCCQLCREVFYSEHKRKYCSKACNSTSQTRKAGAVPKEQYLAAVRNPAHAFYCDQCGKPAARRRSGSNTTNGYANRWCSMACRVEHAAIGKAERDRNAERLRAYRAVAKAITRLARLRTPPVAIPARTCAMCGDAYERVKGQRFNRCPACAEQCKIDSVRRDRALARKRPSVRAARLKAKAIRRAKERRIEAVAIDPIRVFDRDKWRCQLCGVSTPKALRGGYQPRAPELDHVVPLAMGGSHTWANVQCSCRACNIRKGARPLGQIGLGFEV